MLLGSFFVLFLFFFRIERWIKEGILIHIYISCYTYDPNILVRSESAVSGSRKGVGSLWK